MDRGGLGAGEVLAGLGGVVVLIALFFLPWYGVGEAKLAPIEIRQPVEPSLYAQAEPPTLPSEPQEPGLPSEPPMGIPPEDLPSADLPENFGAWEAQGLLGTLANLVILAAALAALRIALAGATRGRLPGLPGAATAALGAAALVAVALRMLFAPEEIDDFEFEATLEAGIFIALAGAALIAAGGLLIARTRAAGPSRA